MILPFPPHYAALKRARLRQRKFDKLHGDDIAKMLEEIDAIGNPKLVVNNKRPT